MKIKVGLIAPFPPPSAGMTVLAHTISSSLEKTGILVDKINTNAKLPKLIRILNIGQLYQYIHFYMKCTKIIKNDIILIISSSGGSFYFKVIPALFFCKISRKKVILDFVGGDMLAKLNKLNIFLLRLFENIFVPTTLFEIAFKEKGINCTVFPHIVDVERFYCNKISSDKITLLSAKALAKYSSIDDLIKAFAIVQKEFPKAELLIAGDGPEKENLQNLISKLGLQDIKFIGNVKYEEMPSLYQNATILIHGTKIESFGIALVEAMASNTPIVSTNVGGIPNVVDNNVNGFLVDHGDYRSMAEKVLKILKDKPLYNKISKNGYSKSQQYSPSVLTLKLISKIDAILQS